MPQWKPKDGKAAAKKKETTPFSLGLHHILSYGTDPESGSMGSSETTDKNRLIAGTSSKSRTVSLVANDFVIVCIEYVQMLALLQSMGLRWPWPAAWLYNMPGLFLLNADVWEFSKFLVNGTFKDIQDYDVPSSQLPLEYWALSLAWALIAGSIAAAFGAAHITLSVRSHPFLMVQHAKLQRAAVVVIQVTALPLWSCLAKVFHCVPANANTTAGAIAEGSRYAMDVSNNVQCFSPGLHLAYLVPTITIGLIFFIGFPAWLIRKTKREIVFIDSKGHEAYLQLKETEYLHGLDVQYITAGYHIFSSFRLGGAHTRAALHLVKFGVLLLYSALHSYSYYQALAVTILCFATFISVAILRPYRLPVFNVLLTFSYFCLTLCALLGALRTAFSVYSIRTVWLTPTYLTGMLAAINGLWLSVAVAALLFIVLRSLRSRVRCVTDEPLWPSLMSPEAVQDLPELTQKYMKSILAARRVAERCMSTPAIFAPAHEVSRQIQIINAHCREAEMTGDMLEHTLWHLLDELVTVHSQVASVSIFADSVSELSRATAERLAEMAPALVRRLAQREYDFLLVPPKKRRLLLKLYCLRTFLAIPRGKSLADTIQQVSSSDKHKLPMYQSAADYMLAVLPTAELGPRVGIMDENELLELRGESAA